MAVAYERRERRDKRESADVTWTSTDLHDDEAGRNALVTTRRDDGEITPLLQTRSRQPSHLNSGQSSPSGHATHAEVYSEANRTESAPVDVQGVAGQDEEEQAVDENTGRRGSKWRWQKGDFSYKVW